MSAYWICVYKAVHDQDKVTAYAELAGPAIRPAAVASSPAATPRRPSSSAR